MSPKTAVAPSEPWGLARGPTRKFAKWPGQAQRPWLGGVQRPPLLREWFEESRVAKSRGLRHEEWIAERLRFATMVLRQCVTVDPAVRGGVPVLKGTRVPIAQILAELCDDASVSEIAEDLDLDVKMIVKLLEGMAIHLDRPFFR